MADAKKEEDFDKFLKGEKVTITDDMTLQDIFKTYYSKAKEVDLKKAKVVNSALSSINSFSSKLEKRRQAAKKAKEAKEAAAGKESEKDGAKMKSKAEDPTQESKT